jgi:TPR repeat protein
MSVLEPSSLATPRNSTSRTDESSGEDLYQRALACEVTGDFAKAAGLYNIARRAKHGKSCARLGFMLIDGRPGVKRNEAEAFACASEGSELGCPDSKGTLSRCYLGGRGVNKDPKQALALCLESVRAGSQYGQATLGGMHQFGEVDVHFDATNHCFDIFFAREFLGTSMKRNAYTFWLCNKKIQRLLSI